MTDPIFVSGPGRSGTTFMQCFLSSHPDVHIHGQPSDVFQVWKDLLYRMLERADWLTETNADFARKGGYPVAHYAGSDKERSLSVWRHAFRDYMTGCGTETPRWGMKTVSACTDERWVKATQQVWPDAKWVMCMRDPWQAFISHKATFNPNGDLENFLTAWVQCAQFESDAVFQIDKINDLERKSSCRQILFVLGLDATSETLRFAEDWPTIHRWDHRPHVKLEQSVVDEILSRHPTWQETIELLGYSCEVPT